MDSLITELNKAKRIVRILKVIEWIVSIQTTVVIILLLFLLFSRQSNESITVLIVILSAYSMVRVSLRFFIDKSKRHLYQRVDRQYSQMRGLQTEIQKLLKKLTSGKEIPANETYYLVGISSSLVISWERVLPQEEVSLGALQSVSDQINATKKTGLSTVQSAVLASQLIGIVLIVVIEAAQLMSNNNKIALLG